MKNISRIIAISKPLHKIVFILTALILTTAVLNIIAPLLSKSIVDEIVAHIQTKTGSINKLILLIVAAFGANLVALVLNVASERLGDHFAGRIRKFLTEKFYDKVLRLPHAYFDSEISGKIINQLTRGITSIQQFLNGTTNFILPTFLQSIFTVVVLAYYNLSIGLFMAALFPIYMGISYYSTKKWGESEFKKNAIEDSLRGRMQEVIANISLVKGFVSEKREFKTVEDKLTESNKIYSTQSQTFHIFDFFRGLSLNIIIFIINLIVFYQTFTGHLTIGEMVLILQLVALGRIPLFAMSFILTQIQMAETGSKEYFDILNLPSVEDYTKVEKAHKLNSATLDFKNVSFKYETSENVLNDVSFHLSARETVALVGHSGAGKSTIVNLILKFYNPTNGNILMNKKNYADLNHSFIRNNIALVFQENELFSTTIKENVAYGKPDATDEEIIEALQKANAWDFVQKLPKGIDSEVGERGVRLSGGQKQRIQIARAILKNAPILILDEATSSLDAKSEKEVQEGLEMLRKNRLTIIIAHRFSTIQNADKIIVLDKGIIADYGTPPELAKKQGVYHDLLQFQVEGNKKLLETYGLY